METKAQTRGSGARPAPPTCLQCTTQPVKRIRPSAPVGKGGARIVDGVRWAHYCGRRCAGRAVGAMTLDTGDALARLQRGRQSQIREAGARVLARLQADLRKATRPDGLVSPADLLPAIRRELRRAKARAYMAGRDSVIRRWARAESPTVRGLIERAVETIEQEEGTRWSTSTN